MAGTEANTIFQHFRYNGPELVSRPYTQALCQMAGQRFGKNIDREDFGRSPDEELHMGFCFSFPVEQTSIDKGKIVVMTKKFSNPRAEGADPVGLLREACRKAGQKVQTSRVVSLECGPNFDGDQQS